LGSYQFDIDLKEGQIAEAKVRDMLQGRLGPIEVKRDTIVSQSGNIAIEFECRGQPSGIETSMATWWAFELSGEQYGDEIIIWIEANRLRAHCHWLIEQGKCKPGGDDGESKMALLHLGRLLLWNPSLVRTAK